MNTKQINKCQRDKPLSAEEILLQDNIPASEKIPTEIAKRMTEKRIVVSSESGEHNLVSNFKRIEGCKGAWELRIEKSVIDGIIVKTQRVEQNTVNQHSSETEMIDPYRPLWHPYIYHPKTMVRDFKTPVLKRKNGAKIRPEVVFNHDDREMFLPNGYPWHCVGRVKVTTPSGTKFGTGTLVGGRTVLTSAHMIPWNEKIWTLNFTPGYWGSTLVGTIFVGSSGLSVESWATEAVGYNEPDRSAWDFAVVRLAEPLGQWFGTLGVLTYTDDWEDDPRWTLVGYPGIFNVALKASGLTSVPLNSEFPTRQFGISIEDDDSDGSALELEHRADTTPGNSGGPLFGFWPQGPYLIGVHSGSANTDYVLFTDFDSIAAGGNAMVNLVRWANNNWL